MSSCGHHAASLSGLIAFDALCAVRACVSKLNCITFKTVHTQTWQVNLTKNDPKLPMIIAMTVLHG